MHDAHEMPDAIQWHEGMLLSPQHFQQMVLRQELLSHYYLGAANPFFWGVRRFKINPNLLVGGTFQVVELEAVLPDGLVITHGLQSGAEQAETPLQIDLGPFAEEMKQKPTVIQLVVPARKTGEILFKGDLARFDSVESRPISDENTGENELQIPRLRPRLSLLATDAPPAKYVGIPLAKVAFANESFTITEYLPPTLAVPLNSPLGSLCSQVARRLREKAVFLSYEVLAPSSTSGQPLVLETKTLIQSMVASLPYFEAVLNTGVSHPLPLYLALCQLVGNIAALGTLIPPVLQPYNHNDPLACFEQAKQYIFRTLEEGIHEAYMNIPFHFENEMFGTQFDAAWMDKPVYIGVRGQPGVGEKEVVEWVQKSWIGSSSKIMAMCDKRILGPERKRIDRVEDLVPARGVMMFALKIDPKYIVPGETLHIYNTTTIGPRPAEITLYIKKQAEPLM